MPFKDIVGKANVEIICSADRQTRGEKECRVLVQARSGILGRNGGYKVQNQIDRSYEVDIRVVGRYAG